MFSALLALAVKALLPAAAAGASWAIARIVALVSSRAKTDKQRQTLDRLETAANLAVAYIEQTARKDFGEKLTREQAQVLAGRALEAARMFLAPAVAKEARGLVGDLDVYLRALIERRLLNIKQWGGVDP